MERKVHHRKKDVGKEEKEATHIRCKKWKVKQSGEWRKKYIIERRTSERERERATHIRCKKWKVKDSGECAAGGPWIRWFAKYTLKTRPAKTKHRRT